VFLALCVLLLLLLFSGQVQSEEPAPAPESTSQDESGKPVDFKKLKNPVPFTNKSIARGKTVYIRFCADCHGRDGKAMIDFISDATDLTAPKRWRHGTTPGEIFHSIRDGAGVAMPPYKIHIPKETDLWHLVNFVQSLWPESVRPKLQKESDHDTDDHTKQEGTESEGGGDGHEQNDTSQSGGK